MPMTDTRVPYVDERRAGSHQAGRLFGRAAELDLIRAFRGSVAPAASAAAAAGTRAGVAFEAGMSFSGVNQVLLPLLAGKEGS